MNKAMGNELAAASREFMKECICIADKYGEDRQYTVQRAAEAHCAMADDEYIIYSVDKTIR